MAVQQDSSTAEIVRWDPDKDASQPRHINGRLVEYRSFETAYGDLLCMAIEDDSGTVSSRKINNPCEGQLSGRAADVVRQQLGGTVLPPVGDTGRAHRATSLRCRRTTKSRK